MDVLLSAGAVLAAGAVLVFSGLRRTPGIGVAFSVLVLVPFAVFRPGHLETFGYSAPVLGWPVTVCLGAVLGIAIQLSASILLEPAIERLTRKVQELRAVEGAKKNLPNLLLWIAASWLLAAVLEETIYRGFFFGEGTRILGTAPWAQLVILAFSSAVFGLSHAYQGATGILSTGSVGILLGIIFIASGRNVWLPLFTHGFIDTAGFLILYRNAEDGLRRLVWKKTP